MATEYKGEEFTFPDEEKETPVQQELDIDADTEEKPQVKATESEDPTDEELAQYDETVRNKLKKYTNNYHNERRARKAAQREREEAENFAKSVYEENKRLKHRRHAFRAFPLGAECNADSGHCLWVRWLLDLVLRELRPGELVLQPMGGLALSRLQCGRQRYFGGRCGPDFGRTPASSTFLKGQNRAARGVAGF
jgi:hypothetical protein